MIKEISDKYVDTAGKEYRFRISKSINRLYYDVMIFCLIDGKMGPMYECDSDSIIDIPSEDVSDEAKNYIKKYIKNIAFT